MKCIFIFIFIIASCYAEIEFSERAENFSLELLHYTQVETDGHAVVSPFGIWSLMTGVALGATGNSRSQLTTAFLLPENQTSLINGYKNLTKTVLNTKTQEVKLENKNFVFIDKELSILPTFKRTLTSDFEASIIELDFKNSTSAALVANTAIDSSGATVSNVLRSDDFRNFSMIWTNVISFKGLWSFSFNVSETNIEPFYDENYKQIGQVKMMYQRAMIPFSNIKSLTATVIELPYGNDNKYSMLIILPYPKTKVSEVYKKLSTITLKNISEIVVSEIEEYGLELVDVNLPRFKINTNVVLNEPLSNMGVIDIFNPKLASFENISKNETYISTVVHKADIEVTESGLAVFDATPVFSFERIPVLVFAVNRPFIYFVIEKPTTTVVFSGIYSKPSIF